MRRESHSYACIVENRLGEINFKLGRVLFILGERKRALHHIFHGLRYNRTGFAQKIFLLTLTTVKPWKFLTAGKHFLKKLLKTAKEL